MRHELMGAVAIAQIDKPLRNCNGLANLVTKKELS